MTTQFKKFIGITPARSEWYAYEPGKVEKMKVALKRLWDRVDRSKYPRNIAQIPSTTDRVGDFKPRIVTVLTPLGLFTLPKTSRKVTHIIVGKVKDSNNWYFLSHHASLKATMDNARYYRKQGGNLRIYTAQGKRVSFN